MSERSRGSGDSASEPEPQSKGPSLTLIYILLVAGILAAMGVAALIVRPFFLRR